MKDEKYSFRIREGDKDIKEILCELNTSERSDFIRDAIRFYANHQEKINSIDNKLEEILKRLEIKFENLLVSPSVSQANYEKSKKLDEKEELLAESVMDLLSM
jgi:hypothetical protein